MKVKKAVPSVLRVSKISIQKANMGIRNSKNRMKKGLTSTVIGAEEAERQEPVKGGLHLPGGNHVERLLFQGKRPDKGRLSNQYWKSSKARNINQTIYQQREAEAKAGTKKTGIISNGTISNETIKTGTVNAGTYQNTAHTYSGWQTDESTAGMTDSWIRTGRIAALQGNQAAVQTGTVSARATAGTTMNTAAVGAAKGAAAIETTVQGAITKGAGAVGTAAVATAGAATGGTVTAAMAVAKAAKRTQERFREALEVSVMGKSEVSRMQKPQQGQLKVAKGNKDGTGILFLLAGIPALFFVLMISVLFILLLSFTSLPQQPASDHIVEAARQELAASDANIGGDKYKNWYGMDADWCAMFVSWCANECGYIASGIMPKTASVASMKSWYQQQGQYHAKESGYQPKPGDVILFGNGRSHTGLVVEYDEASGIVTTIEGNTGSSGTTPYHKGSRVKEKKYPLTYATIAGYGSPAYPSEVIDVPEPFGTEYSYMGWQMITSPSSKQYKLRQEAGMNFDENGFGKIGERYVIACTLTFGQVGDYIDWELANGAVLKTVIGDIKNQNDEGCNQWGHKNGLCVVEFVVDKVSWYGSGRYPTDFHADWNSRVVRAVKTGNYWN